MEKILRQNTGKMSKSFFYATFVFLVLFVCTRAQAQVKMSDMISPADSWGLIDVNQLYGGCMQFNSYADLLNVDVQYLKKGMLFVVYDYDGNNSNGLDTRIYMFLPTSGSWNYTSPFEIPSGDQNKTIATKGLEPYLKKIDTGGSGDNLGNHTATEALKMGTFQISNDGSAGKGLNFDADASGNATFGQNVTVNGNLYTLSDKRLKTNIVTLTNVLDKIEHLRGVEFEYIDQKKYATGPKIGVIAQELLEVFPQMVSTGSDGYLKVDYSQLTGVLIQAVKEQRMELTAQQLEIEEIKSRMNKLQEKVDSILSGIK